MGNNAVEVNPSDYGVQINDHGSDWYWVVFAIMLGSSLAFAGLAFTVPRTERIFHYITMAITLTASVAYFSMASNLGAVGVATEFYHQGGPGSVSREIFYARYIDWTITTPLLLLDLLLLSGLPWSTIAFIIFADVGMIITGLIGALVSSSYKWGYWTFGMFFFFIVVYMIVGTARTSSLSIGDDVHKLYIGISLFTMIIWTLYPIAWGLAEGGNVIGADGEAVFYGILDVLAKPIFGFWILFGHRSIGLDRLGLAGSPRVGVAGNGVGHHNKVAPVGSTPAATGTTPMTSV